MNVPSDVTTDDVRHDALGTTADGDVFELHAIDVCKRFTQTEGAGLRVAMCRGRGFLHGFDRTGWRSHGVFIGRQMNEALDAELLHQLTRRATGQVCLQSLNMLGD
jgi:hypothetical protein